jgi:hypothetical protein
MANQDWRVVEPLVEPVPEPQPDGLRALEAQMVRLGLAVLGQRALVWAATAVAAGLWGYAIAHPEPWRLLAAAGYAICVLGPVYWRDLKLGGKV